MEACWSVVGAVVCDEASVRGEEGEYHQLLNLSSNNKGGMRGGSLSNMDFGPPESSSGPCLSTLTPRRRCQGR